MAAIEVAPWVCQSHTKKPWLEEAIATLTVPWLWLEEAITHFAKDAARTIQLQAECHTH